MPHRQSIAEILALLRGRQNFLITSHTRPDGDAIGSALGMMHLLEGMGKQAVVAFADPIPRGYAMLPGVERIMHALPEAAPDAIVLLECDRFARTGFDVADFERIGDAFTINIDHHRSGKKFASYNWIDPEAPAVGAMVYDLAVASGVAITPGMATCLYTAVLTDTGSFTYQSTTAATFALAAHLVERGADANEIAQAIYFSNPASKIRLLGAALRNVKIKGGVAWSWVTQPEMDEAGAEVEDCEGVVNYLIGIADVEAAAFLREQPGETAYRLSLRSKGDVDVAAVAESFGGGGHRNASGCNAEGTLEQVIARIVPALRASCSC
jgi:phosphoesterase RecJ-like protein